MVYDDQQNAFLDNIIKNASNEELFKMEQARKPASVQPQASVQVEDVPVEPVDLGGLNYRFQNPVTQIYTENVNRALKQRQADMGGIAENYGGAIQADKENKIRLGESIKKLQEVGKNKSGTPELLLKQISDSYKDINQEKVPERNALSEAILSFGPALFGSLTGEAGQLSQAAAGQQARKQYEAGRAEDVKAVAAKNKSSLDKYNSLVKIRESIIEEEQKGATADLDKIKAELSLFGDLSGKSEKNITDMEKTINDMGKEISSERIKGAEKAAEFEAEPAKQAALEKRARIQAAAATKRADNPTEGERKGAFQYGNMIQAEQNLQDLKSQNNGKYPSQNEKFFRLKKDIVSGHFSDSATMSDLLNSKSLDPKIRQQIQAELSFLESIGRIQSGAAIGPKEWLNYREQYIPTWGDNDENVAQKEQQRKTSITGVKAIAGRAAGSAAQPVQVINPKATMSDMDVKALEWANKNKKDPRAIQIFKKLGVQ